MQKKSRVLICVLLAASLLAAGCCAFADEQLDRPATILFTHDLHSHFLPVKVAGGGESGGYARLYTALETERKTYGDTAVLTVDAGDFSMGSLF